ASGFGQKLSRHSIALAGRFQNQREERGYLLRVKVLHYDLCDVSELQSPANPPGQQSALAPPIEVAQSCHDGFTSQVVARPEIVKRSTPTTGAQGLPLVVTRVGDGTCPRLHDHPGSSSYGGVQSNRHVRRQQMMPRRDGLAEPCQ